MAIQSREMLIHNAQIPHIDEHYRVECIVEINLRVVGACVHYDHDDGCIMNIFSKSVRVFCVIQYVHLQSISSVVSY